MFQFFLDHFSSSSAPSLSFIIFTIVLCLLCVAYYIPWRSLYYYYLISETISDLETPIDLRNPSTSTNEITTDEDLCEELRNLLKHYRKHTIDASKVAEVLTHIGIALTRHSCDKDEGIDLLKESLILRRRIFGKVEVAKKKKNSNNKKKEKNSDSDEDGELEEEDSQIPSNILKRNDDYSGDHVTIAQSMNNLGLAMESSGNAIDGLKLQKLSLEMYQRLYDNEDHEAIATAMSNVGESIISFCVSQNKNSSPANNINRSSQQQHTIKEGIKLLRTSLEMRRRLYNHKTNPNHPALWRSMENLALALENFGEFEFPTASNSNLREGEEEKNHKEKIIEEITELRMEAEKIHQHLIEQEKNAEHIVTSLGGKTKAKDKKQDE